ncbi:hypothetical protein [Dyadobacter sp. CY347]|uniref:hypothetical protein n=1 Tax=Dyadobacter sp. CY347 TaxID=2909336 RepID=UPI001F2FB4D9|nr:hypothetical protein [Dyadobacter sp. CY347]MCF2490216.1 hypothetical protein [Dyadobacter sp. CY347]
MYTQQKSTNKEMNGGNEKFIGNEAALMQQFEIVKEFFQTDSGSEMIGSLHAMVESYLFSENLSQVSPEMREHIVNQLRVATLIARLGDSYNGSKSGELKTSGNISKTVFS